jgi:hypothetical protein
MSSTILGVMAFHASFVSIALNSAFPVLVMLGGGSLIVASVACGGRPIDESTWRRSARRAGWSESAARRSWKILIYGTVGLLATGALALT